jgi:hypothetical protein
MELLELQYFGDTLCFIGFVNYSSLTPLAM